MARVVAIDLGRYAAKAVVYETTGKDAGALGMYSERVADDGTGRSPSLGARLAALDRLLEEHHTWQSPATQVCLAWPTDDTASRQVVLPFTDRAQIEQTLPFTVEELVPFDLEDMILGWRPVPSEAAGTTALVTLAPLADLRGTLEALQSRSVDPRHVVVDGEALAASISEQGGVAIIDVGHSSTTLGIVRDGVVLQSRAVDVAGRRFTQAIATAMEVDFATAERIKHGEVPVDDEPTEGGDGAPSVLSPAARTALDAAVGLLLAEVRSTLIMAEDQHGFEFESIYLTGGGARLEPLAGWLQKDLGLPVKWLVDAEGAPIPPEHGVAQSLATVAAEEAAVINLRTGPLAFKGGVNVLRAVMTYGTAGVAFFLLAATVVFVVQFVRLSAEEGRVDDDIAAIVLGDFPETPVDSLAVSSDAAELMGASVERLERRVDVIAGEGRVPPMTDLLLRLTQAFPDPDDVVVDVSDLTMNENSITFNAETDSYESAAVIELSIHAVAEFKDAVKSDEVGRGDKVSFRMTIPLTQAQSPQGAP